MPRQLLITEWLMIGGFLGSLIVLGGVMRKDTVDANSTFLADRSLPWWMQSFSIIATNLNANDFIGLAGVAYAYGLVMVGLPITYSVGILVASIVIIPVIRRYKVFSLGEWLNKRYESPVGDAYDFIWTFVWMVFNMGLYVYAGAFVLNTLLGWPLWPSVALVMIVGTTYTLLGGFGAVAGSDTVQFILMFLPFVILLPLALAEVGGLSSLIDGLASNKSTLWPARNPLGSQLPLFGNRLNAVFIHVGFLFFALSYWSAEAQILQRPLAAKSSKSAQLGYLSAGLWYALIVPIGILIPGIIAAVLYPGLEVGDRAMPMLISNVIPPGLYGVVVVGLLAGVLSSIDSQLNNFQTIFIERIYKRHVSKNKNESHYMSAANIAGILFMLLTVGTTYVFSQSSLMFLLIFSILAIIMPPFAAIALIGGLWDGATTKGALTGLIFGLPYSLYLGFALGHQASYARAFYTLPPVMLVIIIASILTSSAEDEEKTGLLQNIQNDLKRVVPPSVQRAAGITVGFALLLVIVLTAIFGM
jgi:SSS family solute:Na+ symporter